MALTFYYGSGSPFAWKVWLILEHKGIPYEFRLPGANAIAIAHRTAGTDFFTALSLHNPRAKHNKLT